MYLSAELYFKVWEEMRLNKKEITENELDWSDYVYELQCEITYLRQRIKKLNWDRFNKETPYHLMIKHRLEKIFSVYYKKHKKMNKRFLVDYVTGFCRSNDIIYAKDINECIDKFNKKYGFRIIKIQDLEFTLN